MARMPTTARKVGLVAMEVREGVKVASRRRAFCARAQASMGWRPVELKSVRYGAVVAVGTGLFGPQKLLCKRVVPLIRERGIAKNE